MTTLYPMFNWKDFAMRLARAIEDHDEDGMADGAKDSHLFENIPCPTVVIGGPMGGLTSFCCARDVEPGQCDHADAEYWEEEADRKNRTVPRKAFPVGNLEAKR